MRLAERLPTELEEAKRVRPAEGLQTGGGAGASASPPSKPCTGILQALLGWLSNP